MQIEVKGTPLPVAICHLAPGESIVTEKGAMSWMSPNLEMQTKGGGVGKMFSRALQGEAMFQNIYTAVGGEGMIAMGSSFPGEIMVIDVAANPVIAQKSSFLASETTVTNEMFFRKKVGAGLFGGEGFIMQKFTGSGKVILEIDGSVMLYELKAGESMLIDTGCLALMDASVNMEIETVKGIGNKLFGGEGFFNTRVTGPGRVWLQTMPVSNLSRMLAEYIPTAK
ncbi:MAG: TIGR00266 family protein [Ruminococcus sp.]|nr:TIGR00266 family protein [Ruminococcus sp.]